MYITRLVVQGDLVLYETLYDGTQDGATQFFERIRQLVQSPDLNTPTTIALNDGVKFVTYCLVSENE